MFEGSNTSKKRENNNNNKKKIQLFINFYTSLEWPTPPTHLHRSGPWGGPSDPLF
jgi:hypothetical protein